MMDLIEGDGDNDDYDDEDDSNLDSEMLDEFDADGFDMKKNSSSGASSIKSEKEEVADVKKEKGKTGGAKASAKNLKNIKIQETNEGPSSPKNKPNAPLSPKNGVSPEKLVPTTAGNADPSIKSAYEQSESSAVQSKKERIRERRMKRGASQADTSSMGGASKVTRSVAGTMRGGKKASAEISGIKQL